MSTSSIASPSSPCVRCPLLSTRCARRTCGPSRPRHRCEPGHRCGDRAPFRRRGRAWSRSSPRSLEPGSGGHLAGSLRGDRRRDRRGRRHRVADRGRPLRSRRATAPRSSRRSNGELGPVDISVNNAAACFYLSIDETSERRLRVAYEVNVITPYLLTKAVVPGMRARGAGWIVNITERDRRPAPTVRSRHVRRPTRRARPRSTGSRSRSRPSSEVRASR